MSQQQGRNKEECWALGLRLDLDEQRYVLELFPESRVMLKLSEREWLEQTEFRLKKDGSLDLRSLYCRLPAQGNEPRRYHRAPRYQPLPPAPQRKQKQREPTVQTPESEVQMPEMDGPEQYRKELIARARAAYPNAAPEMAAKLDR